jgi:hypothetical protein
MGEASDRYTALTREQWGNYKRFGIPNEDYLLDRLDNKAILGTNLASAEKTVQTAGNVAASELNRGISQYGITQSADQMRVNERLNKLSTTAGMASARNFVRQEKRDEDQTILNGSPNTGLQTV